MKKLFFLLLFTIVNGYSQQHNGLRLNDVDQFNWYIMGDPVASWKDGINMGAGFEYQGPIYAGLSYRTMPVLEDGYNEVVGNIGFPFISGYRGEYEYRIGVQAGWVHRKVWGPTFAFQLGFKKSIGGNGWYIFTQGGWQWRDDWRQYSAPAEWQAKGDLGIGKRF
jgi:hypothetical protein